MWGKVRVKLEGKKSIQALPRMRLTMSYYSDQKKKKKKKKKKYNSKLPLRV